MSVKMGAAFKKGYGIGRWPCLYASLTHSLLYYELFVCFKGAVFRETRTILLFFSFLFVRHFVVYYG